MENLKDKIRSTKKVIAAQVKFEKIQLQFYTFSRSQYLNKFMEKKIK